MCQYCSSKIHITSNVNQKVVWQLWREVFDLKIRGTRKLVATYSAFNDVNTVACLVSRRHRGVQLALSL